MSYTAETHVEPDWYQEDRGAVPSVVGSAHPSGMPSTPVCAASARSPSATPPKRTRPGPVSLDRLIGWDNGWNQRSERARTDEVVAP